MAHMCILKMYGGPEGQDNPSVFRS
jgi:hypothetical protein